MVEKQLVGWNRENPSMTQRMPRKPFVVAAVAGAIVFGGYLVNGERNRELNRPPQISVTLESHKSEYLQREPIRLNAVATNIGTIPKSDKYPRDGCKPWTFEFYQVLAGGELILLPDDGFQNAYLRLICGGSHDSSAKSTWTLAPGESEKTGFSNSNQFSPGEVRIRAAFVFRKGKWNGNTYYSNDVVVPVREPEGRNREAYEYVLAQGKLMEGLNYAYKYLDYHLARGREMPKDIVHDEFLEKYGDTVYAEYVRKNCLTHGVSASRSRGKGRMGE
jgi:hypothetical protein